MQRAFVTRSVLCPSSLTILASSCCSSAVRSRCSAADLANPRAVSSRRVFRCSGVRFIARCGACATNIVTRAVGCLLGVDMFAACLRAGSLWTAQEPYSSIFAAVRGSTAHDCASGVLFWTTDVAA